MVYTEGSQAVVMLQMAAGVSGIEILFRLQDLATV